MPDLPAARLRTLDFAGGVAAGAAALDLLCVAPHPDDAELGMGGTLAREAARGLQVGVLDLTTGTMATNGTPEVRLEESAAASVLLGLRWRGNLGLPDRGLEGADCAAALAGALRLLRPAVVFIPCPDDPHPDHAAAFRLSMEAIFSAGLRRFPVPEWAAPAAFRPRAVLQYFINGWRDPALALDVSAVYEVKRRSIAAHASQFRFASTPTDPGAPTRLNSGAAAAQVEARDRFLGAQLGADFAEGFIPARTLLVRDTDGWFGGDRS